MALGLVGSDVGVLPVQVVRRQDARIVVVVVVVVVALKQEGDVDGDAAVVDPG